MKVCAADDCNRQASALGLCTLHYQRERRERLRQGRVGLEKALQPCGTPAAFRRHVRAGEKPCVACSEADARRRREEVAGKRERAAAEAAPRIEVEGDRVVLHASLGDAAVIAAAVLDRALALERLTSTTSQAVEDRVKAGMLRALHKKLAQATRAAA